MEFTKEWVSKRIPKRPKDAHKGDFGKVLAVAGSARYPGAAFLVCAACYRVGAGLVSLVTDPLAKIIVSKKLPEVTFLSPEDKVSSEEFDVLLLGPGLGQTTESAQLVQEFFKKNFSKSVIDADALNILAKIDDWWKQLTTEAILTPHPGEMARLTGLPIEKIQKDRENIAQEYAQKWGQIVVLKGANTVIASPFGKSLVSPFANPALATAGTGDVLAGAIAGMLAQGLELFDAAAVGVYIHGAAGEILRKKVGEAGVLASDLLPILPQIIKDLV